MTFTILVPIDFSPTAENALTYALDIASTSGGTVYMLHVFTPIEKLIPAPEDIRDAYNDQNEEYLMRSLNGLKDKWQPHYPNANMITRLGFSPLVKSTLEFACDNNVNLIVMGTAGANKLRKALLGTHTSHVLKRSTIPVLLVPGEYEWTEPKRIVMATNYQKTDTRALALAGEIAKGYNASVEIVHLSVGDGELPEILYVEARYLETLREKLPEYNIASSSLTGDMVRSSLECLHEAIPYDLLVMIRHRMGMLEKLYTRSNTTHMACVTRFPLLVVPEVE